MQMINKEEVQRKISDYVINLFNQYGDKDLCYHNLQHTQNVVKRTFEIAGNYSLNETELFILDVSAWFHDTGQLSGSIALHEDRSVQLMKDCLQTNGIAEDIIKQIESCICATKLPHHPKSLLEEIICDADTYDLGTIAFVKTDKLLKKEYELRNIPAKNWEEKTLNLLQSHKFFTQYCQSLLNKGKEENIEMVRYLFHGNDNANKQ